MRFKTSDIVRVVTAIASPFWGYTGRVIEIFEDGVLGTGAFYRVEIALLNTDTGVALSMPLLFHETWLAYAGE